jgi:hypothetical protein
VQCDHLTDRESEQIGSIAVLRIGCRVADCRLR